MDSHVRLLGQFAGDLRVASTYVVIGHYGTCLGESDCVDARPSAKVQNRFAGESVHIRLERPHDESILGGEDMLRIGGSVMARHRIPTSVRPVEDAMQIVHEHLEYSVELCALP